VRSMFGPLPPKKSLSHSVHSSLCATLTLLMKIRLSTDVTKSARNTLLSFHYCMLIPSNASKKLISFPSSSKVNQEDRDDFLGQEDTQG